MLEFPGTLGFSTPSCTLVSVRLFTFPPVFPIKCNRSSTGSRGGSTVGTIIERKRAKGVRYTAQVRIKRGGKVVHRENETFSTRHAAQAWIDKREKAIGKPGGLEAAITAPKGDDKDVPLADVIAHYVRTSRKKIGKTKAQCLESLKGYDIAQKRCSTILSVDIVALAEEMLAEEMPNGKPRKSPQTVNNYMSHLAAVMKIARPAWGYPLDYRQMEDARTVMDDLGYIAKSNERERRPTLGELDRLLAHFQDRSIRRPGCSPMVKLIGAAIFCLRRQEELCTMRWEDLDLESEPKRVLIRDMKHPGDKVGNDVWCDLTPEAVAIIQSMPRVEDRIFPYNPRSVSAAFTRATRILGITREEDPPELHLHFHDLRHEGISWLFELGKDIAHVQPYSGHRSWNSLKRYAQIRKPGNKFEGWKWLPILTAPTEVAPMDEDDLDQAA